MLGFKKKKSSVNKNGDSSYLKILTACVCLFFKSYTQREQAHQFFTFLALHTEPPGVGPTAEEKNLNNQSGELATRVSHPTELPLPLQRIISEDLKKVEASKQNVATPPAEPYLITHICC